MTPLFDKVTIAIATVVLAPIFAIQSFFAKPEPVPPPAPLAVVQQLPEENFGALPNVPANFNDALASRIAGSDTSMSLVNGTDLDGLALTGYTCFTLDTGYPTLEYVCGTASGTAVTALTRGITASNPNATSSVRMFAHRKGASVQVTDFPLVNFMKRLLSGTDALDAPLLYTGVSTSSLYTNNNYLASVGYVNSVAISGAPNASESQNGIAEAATQAEMKAGNATGTTGALLFLQSKYANATSSATNTIPIAIVHPGSVSATLSQTFLNLNEPFNFGSSSAISASGTATFGATTTVSGRFVVSGNASTTGVFEGAGTSTFSGNVFSTGATFPIGLIAASTTDVSATLNGATTTILSVAIPTSTLATQGSIVEFFAELSGGTINGNNLSTSTFTLSFGGTFVSSLAMRHNGQSAVNTAIVSGRIISSGAASQDTSFRFENTNGDVSHASTSNAFSGNNATAVSATSSKTLLLQVVGGSTDVLTFGNWYVRKIQ